MKTVHSLAIGLAALGIAVAAPASAAPIIDQSPDVLAPFSTNFTASNTTNGQNFLVQFTLANTAQIGGFSIFSIFSGFPSAVPVTIKFRNDNAGTPDTVNAFTFSTVLSAIDNLGSSANPSLQRLHADFAPLTLGPGTYWAGLSGTGGEIGWNIDFNHGAGGAPACQFGGDTLQFCFSSNTALAFTVDGVSVGGVPESATWAMLILGMGVVGAGLRHRRREAALA